MKNALRAALFFAALLLPGLAWGQCSFPTPVPANVVIGRLGVGPGPCQAIPFSVLSSKLTGAIITLNSGNGQTAPGGMSGGNTYSFGATTDTPQFTGAGFGGAAPATGLEIYNTAVSPTLNGQGVFGASAINGGMLAGQGSTYDSSILNKSLAVALGVPTGTQNLVFGGAVTAASLGTVGTVAGSICATSGGLILYEVAVNCFTVSGISVTSGKTLTVTNTITLSGTDGTTFTFPGSSDTVATLGQTQTLTGNKTFSGTVNITGTGQINGSPFGTFATTNYATPPAIGGTTPAAGTFSTLTATTPMGLSSGGTNGGTAAAARASTGLNIDEITFHGDSNYQILAGDRTVGTSATLTAARTWTLPAASSVNSGQHLYIQDFKGFVSNTNTITIPRNGSDLINGGTGSQTINTANGGFLFISDGVSNWSAQALGAQATSGVASINGQTGSPSIVPGTGINVATTGGNIQVTNTETIDGGNGPFTTDGVALRTSSNILTGPKRNYFDNAAMQVAQITGLNTQVSVSGAISGTAGVIRLTATTTTMITGAQIQVNGVTGTTEANGTWLATVVDGTHVELQGSTFVHSYVSGGTVNNQNGTAVNVTSSTANNLIIDRFHMNVISPASGTITTQQVAVPTPGNSNFRLRAKVQTAEGSLNASSLYYFEQKVYWQNSADFQFGTANNRSLVIRFGWNSPAGTYDQCVIDSNDQYSYCQNFTISGGQAGVDQLITLTIPGTALGTWHRNADATTGIGAIFTWALAAGSTYTGCTNATWTATLCLGTASLSNGVSSTSNQFDLFDVGVYIGSTLPAFQVPRYDLELATAQRYVFPIGLTTTFGGPIGVVENTTTAHFFVQLPNMISSEVSGGGALQTSGTASDYILGAGTGGSTTVCTSVPSIFTSGTEAITSTSVILVFTATAHGLTANTLARGWENTANGKLYVLTQF